MANISSIYNPCKELWIWINVIAITFLINIGAWLCGYPVHNKEFTGLIFLDLRKALDTVYHATLLVKLDHYMEFAGHLIPFFAHTYIDNSSSHSIEPTSRYLQY